MIQKIYMTRMRGFSWPRDRVHLACVCGTDHFHARFGGPCPWGEVDWPDGGFGGFQAPPMDPIAIPHMISDKWLSKTPYIMISHSGPNEPFWREVYKGAFICAKRRNIELKVMYPKIAGDFRKQLSLLEEAIDNRPLGIVTTFPDPEHFLPVIEKAVNECDIPIVVLTSKSKQATNTLKQKFPSIGIDDYRVGQLMALKALNTGAIKDKAVVISHLKGPMGLKYRFEGIKSVLNQKNISVDQITLNTNNPSTTSIFKQYLKDNDDASGIFCLWGALLKLLLEDILRADSQKRKLYTCTFDKSYIAFELMKKGLLDFFIDCRPFLHGYLSMMQPLQNYLLKPQIISSNRKPEKSVKLTDQNLRKELIRA